MHDVASPRPLARSAFHLVLGQVVTTTLAIVLTGAIGQALGPADFGTWYVVTMMATFAYVFVDWGYAGYVIGEVARRPERAGELAGTVLALRAATALLICAPVVLSMWLLGYDANVRLLAALNIGACMPVLLLSSFTWIFRGRERMDLEASLNVTLKVLMLAATLGLLTSGLRLPAVIVAQAVAGILAFLVALRLYARTGSAPLRVNAATARELVHGAAPMFAMGLMVAVQPYIDANLLARLVPREVIGYYGATAVFTGTLLGPALILGAAVYPRLSRAHGDPQAFAALARAAMRTVLLLATLGAVGTFAFADFAVSLVYRDANFAPAGDILRWFSLSLLLVSVDVLVGNVILAAGSIKHFAKAKLLAVMVTTACELVLVPFFQARIGNGGVGVVLSFAVGEAFLIVAGLRLLPRGTLTTASLLDAGRAMVAAAIALGTITMAGSISPLIGIPAMIAIYAIAAFAVGLIDRADVAALLALAGRRARSADHGVSADAARRLRIGKIPVDVVTRQHAISAIAALVERGCGGTVFTPNVDHVVNAESSEALCAAYERASLSLADGMPLVWVAPLLGGALPERVAGSDIFLPLMSLAAERRWRVYLLGAAPEVAEAAALRLTQEHGVLIAGWHSPVVARDGKEVDGDSLGRLRTARPDLVIVALGSPKQELWIARSGEALGPAVACGFGAALDFLVGRQKRAPRWVANAGLEWLYRLAHEPRRLWRRYLVQDPKFLRIVGAAWWQSRRRVRESLSVGNA